MPRVLDNRLRLVRVVAPHFVAGFETDGTIRRAAPIIAYMVGWKDMKAAAYIAKMKWRASIISEDCLKDDSTKPNLV